MKIKALLVGAVILALAGCSSSAKTTTSGGSGSSGGAAASSSNGGTSGGSASGGASGGGGSGIQACSILTKDIATAILGVPTDNGKDEKSFGTPYPACTYAVADVQSASSFATVGLTVFNTAASADGLINEYKTQYNGLVPLSGLGDSALQETDGRLVVAVKNHVGCVMLRAGDVKGSPDASTKAMADVCAKVFAAS